jgi:hypothetical protein
MWIKRNKELNEKEQKELNEKEQKEKLKNEMNIIEIKGQIKKINPNQKFGNIKTLQAFQNLLKRVEEKNKQAKTQSNDQQSRQPRNIII